MCIQCVSYNLSEDYLKGLPKVFRQAMQDLYNGKITPADLHGDLLRAIARELWEGVSLGFDTDYDAHDPESQHYKLIKSFETNVYVFSGFKTYHQLKEATLLLKDAEGNLKPFTQFLKDIQAINQTYNINYLRAEYDHAVVSGQMATKWEQFEANADQFPLLKFVATIDDHTTAICRQLNGLTKPFNWEGWRKYFLPLHWGERSNIIQIAHGLESDINIDDLPKPPAMFSGNVAIDGVIFPSTHPYFKVKNKTAKAIRKRAEAA